MPYASSWGMIFQAVGKSDAMPPSAQVRPTRERPTATTSRGNSGS
jgi:hypothetical protein